MMSLRGVNKGHYVCLERIILISKKGWDRYALIEVDYQMPKRSRSGRGEEKDKKRER